MPRPSFCCLLLLLLPVVAPAQTFQGEWADEFFIAGPNPRPLVMVAHEDRLIAGGSFLTAGRADVLNVAWSDGGPWRAFASGIPDQVRALVVHDDQVLALSRRWESPHGYFKQLWQLVGNQWQALGEEQLLASDALVSFAGDLFLGSHVWDGDAFVDFFLADDLVETLAVHDHGLLIGGRFTACGTDTLGCLVLWDGAQLTRPWPEVTQRVQRATWHGDTVVAIINTSFHSTSIWQWDGGDWQLMPLPDHDEYVNPGFVMSHGGELLAAIRNSHELLPDKHWFLRWTGDAWADVFGANNEITTAVPWRDGLALSTPGFVLDDAWVGTVFWLPDATAGEPLQPVGPVGRGFAGGAVKALHAGADLVVAGSFRAMGDLYSPGAVYLRDDWLPLPVVIDGRPGDVSAVHDAPSAFYAGLCLPAGCVDDCGTYSYAWGSWQQLSQVPQLWSFASLPANQVYGATSATIYRLWPSITTVGNVTGSMTRLSRWDGSLIAHGNISAINGVAVSKIARLQGGQWHAFPAPIGGVVRAAVDWDGQLVIAGYQLDPDGPNSWQVGVWTGDGWQQLGGAFNASLECLAVYAGHLFVGGYFTEVGGVAANRVAGWDGEAWRPLGEGCNQAVLAMVSYADKLWLTGSFSRAGGKPATRLTHWTFAAITGVEPRTPTRSPLALHAPHPNPANPAITVAFDLPRDGPVRLDVHDLRGRLRARLVADHLAAGRHEVVWNGLDDRGRPAPSGVYLVRLQAGDQVATRRLSLVR